MGEKQIYAEEFQIMYVDTVPSRIRAKLLATSYGGLHMVTSSQR